jgi:AraC-like DNA-binding protein
MLSPVFSVLLDLLANQGISETQLLEKTGLKPQNIRAATFFNSQQADEICGNAIKLSGDRLLGAKLGAKLDIVSLGILGYALMTSATAGDMVKILVRYKRVVMPSVCIELIPGPGTLELHCSAAHLPKALEQFYKDSLYAGLVTNLQLLTDNQGVATSLELDYGQPEDMEFYHSIFGTNVRLDSGRCCLIFDAASLAVPITSSDPVAQDIFRRECDRILASDESSGVVSERVKQLLLLSRSEFPTCAAVAEQMHMSESTLQRRLAKEATRFQQLLDQVRYRLALEYLQGTVLPIAEIATLVGFSSSANFSRSFKRWSATTPAGIRQANLPQ